MPQLPPYTKALMLICTAIFCIDSLLQIIPLQMWFGLWPLGSGRFMPWQPLTYAFLHGSVAHLFFNMLGLWMFGAELERLWGQKRYLQLLLASVLTAAAVQLLVTLLPGRFSPTVGASGALYGLLLAYALMFPRRQFDLVGFLPMVLMMMPGQIFYTLGIVMIVLLMTNRQMIPIPPFPVPAKVMVMLFGAIELIQGVLFSNSGIAHFAHLGGMVGAWLMIRYWRGQAPFPARKRW